MQLHAEGIGGDLRLAHLFAVLKLWGLTRKATTRAFGTNSRSTSSRFGASELLSKYTPVLLPPGRLILLTSPSCTGSLPVVKTIGIVAVAACASCAIREPPVVTSTATSAESIRPQTRANDHIVRR